MFQFKRVTISPTCSLLRPTPSHRQERTRKTDCKSWLYPNQRSHSIYRTVSVTKKRHLSPTSLHIHILTDTHIPLTMAIKNLSSVTNPQEPDNDVSLIMESGSFDAISSVSSSTSISTTGDESTGSSSKPYYHNKKTYSSTPQKPNLYNTSNSNRHLQHPPKSSGKRRKPNRLLLYVRNRTLNGNHQLRAYNISAIFVSLILVTLTVQRLLSLYFTHRRWINAPISYMHRSCPLPSYDLLYPSSPKSIEEQQQVQLSRSLLTTTVTSLGTKKSDVSNGLDDKGASSSSSQSLEYSPPLKICLTSLTDQKAPSLIQRIMRWRNFDGILHLTRPNKLAYAKKYGYHLYDGSDYYDPSRPPAWSKIRAVQALFDDNHMDQQPCDWVLWMDADTVIMNSNVRIEDFLPADPTKDLIVVSDKGGGYNSGVFLFRNSLWSKQFLDEWWNMNDFVRPPGLSLSGDNAALKALLRTMEERNIFHDHVLTPPRCTINSFAHFLTLGESIDIMDHLTEQPWYYSTEFYHKGDFIAHIPGFDNKAECLKLLLREAR